MIVVCVQLPPSLIWFLDFLIHKQDTELLIVSIVNKLLKATVASKANDAEAN